MRTRILALLWATALGVTSARAQTYYNPANGHTYVVSPGATGILQARTYAASLGGKLAAITSPAENAFLASHLPLGPGGSNAAYWLGLSDEITEGTFLWDDGEPLGYTNWCGGEPNNAGNEDYVELITPSGCWNDIGGTAPTVKALVELSSGPRADFDGLLPTCTDVFPTPPNGPGNAEHVSWNGAGPAQIDGANGAGFPVSGNRYLRMRPSNYVNLPAGGPLPRPVQPGLNEIRIAIPNETKSLVLSWDFYNAEGFQAAYNDGVSIDVCGPGGNLIAAVAYADVNTALGPGFDTGSACASGNEEVLQAGPQTAFVTLPSNVPCGSYLSIVVWNGGDTMYPSTAVVDAVQFFGGEASPGLTLDISSPAGPGSIRIANQFGGSNDRFWTLLTIYPGSFPNGWFFGLDISSNDFLTEILAGPPFSGFLDVAGSSCFTFGGVPSGIPLQGVSVTFAHASGAFLDASPATSFTTP